MVKKVLSIFAFMLFIGCGGNSYNYYKTYHEASMVIEKIYRKVGVEALYHSLEFSSSRTNINLVLHVMNKKQPIRVKKYFLEYLSNLKEDHYLINYSLNKDEDINLRLYAMHVLFREKMISNLPPAYSDFTFEIIKNNRINNLLANEIRFYDNIPYTNMDFISLIKKKFILSQTPVEVLSCSAYLLNNNALSNKEIIDKYKSLAFSNSFMLLCNLNTGKVDQPTIDYLTSIVSNESTLETKIVVLIKLVRFSVIKESVYSFFKSLTENTPATTILKNRIALIIMLLEDGTGLYKKEYMEYIFRQCMYQLKKNPYFDNKLIFSIIGFEKKFPKITQIIQSYLQLGGDDDILKILKTRKLKFNEIPLVEKHLKSSNLELQYYAAVRILAAYEDKKKQN